MNARVYTTYSARARVTQRQTLCRCSPKDSGRHSDFSPSLQQCSTTNAYYRLRVLDAGPGVAEEELPRLFTPFFRAAAATPKVGYGLGLAVTRRVIELHGGTVSAANRRGGGLCVEVELPLRQNRSETRCLPTRPQ